MALAVGLMATAQVKIGNDPTNINAASLLELENSPTTKQGLLLPRVALSNTTTPTLDGGLNVEGMTVYNTATAGDVTPGLYTNDGTKWVKVGGGTTSSTPSIRGTILDNLTDADLNGYVYMDGTLATITLTPLTKTAGKTITIVRRGTVNCGVAGASASSVTSITVAGRGLIFVCDGSSWQSISAQ